MGLRKAKTWFNLLLKLIGAVLAILLIKLTLDRAGDADFAAALCDADKTLLAATLACYGLVNVLAAWRWQALLAVQGIRIPLRDAFRLTLIGVFFSNIIPGSVSGDLIKGAYIAGYADDRKTEAVLTIAVDRCVGLMGLFLVALLSSALLAAAYPSVILGNPVLGLAIVAIACGCASLALGTAAILWRDAILRFTPAAKLLGFLARHTPEKLRNMIRRISFGMDLYRRHPSAACGTLLISAAIHTLLASMNFMLGKAFHESVMTPLQYIVSTQIGNVTGLFPLTPGGIGIRDSVTSLFLSIFNASPLEAMALIPIAYSLTMVAWALVGAILMVAAGPGTRASSSN